MLDRKSKSSSCVPAEEIVTTILFTGSNDLTVGVLDDQVRAQHPGSTNLSQ